SSPRPLAAEDDGRRGAPSAAMGTWRHAAALVGIAATIAGLPAGVLLNRLQVTRRERDEARVATAAAEQRLTDQAAALERERAAGVEAAPGTPRPIAAPVFTLPLTRGAEAFPPDATRVRVHDEDEWIVLALESEPGGGYRAYRIELASEGG